MIVYKSHFQYNIGFNQINYLRYLLGGFFFEREREVAREIMRERRRSSVIKERWIAFDLLWTFGDIRIKSRIE